MKSLLVAVVAGLAVTTAGYGIAAADDETATVLGPGVVTVDVTVHHSRFDLGDLRVAEGTLVQFVVQNDDPIDHELVVGAPDVHERHRNGTEGRHPPVPGEVSLAPMDRGLTFYEFDEPGPITYACHLPGHEAYGMTGTIDVTP